MTLKFNSANLVMGIGTAINAFLLAINLAVTGDPVGTAISSSGLMLMLALLTLEPE